MLLKEKTNKKMKKFLLTINILICCIFFTYCQHAVTNRTPTGFISPAVKPLEYGSLVKEKIDLQDSDIVSKIHALDCYFEEKVRKNSF